MVQGESMSPVLNAGDLVFLKKAPPVVGDIVVARHPFFADRLVIKRLQSISGSRMTLAGDNTSNSTDSRSLGPISRNRLVGVVESIWNCLLYTSDAADE